MDISSLMKKANELRKKMNEVEETLAKQVVTSEAGGGMVRVTANCKPHILEVKISEQGMREDAEIINELITAAVNDVLKRARKMSKKINADILGQAAGGIDLPFPLK